MNKLVSRASAAIVAGIACMLSACGGGSGDSPATATDMTPPAIAPTSSPANSSSSSPSTSTTTATYRVSGTVAYGKPVAGETVQAIDSAGKTCAQADIANDGTYSMDTTACAPGSAAFTVNGFTTPSGAPLMAVAVPPTGIPVINGVVNVDPLTTLIAYDAAGMVASSVAAGTPAQALALLSHVSANQYAQAQADVLTTSLLQLLQGTYGVSSTSFSAATTPFSADGQGLDAFFDAFPLSAPSAASVQLSPASGPGLSLSVTLPNAATGASSTTSGSKIVSNVSYAVGGSVTGLSGGSLGLQINGGNALTISANGPFTFPAPVANSYAVTVASQPAGQICSVGHGSGSGLNANVTSVAVTCSALTYTIGGSVMGLASGEQLTLADNAGDATVVGDNGAFTFPTPIAYHGSYAVTVALAPNGKTCSVTNGSGSGIASDVSNVAVICSPLAYTVGGTVSNLSGGSLSLLDNSGDSLTMVSNGSFTFSVPVVQGATYNVTVGTQPTGQTCSISNGSGTVNAANITNVSVTCAAAAHVVYLYAPGNNNNQLFGYRIDTTAGTKVPVPNSPYTTATQSNASTMWVATDPAAKFLYAANRNTSSIAGFKIDHTTGALTVIPGSPFASSSAPNAVAVNPAGTFAIVPNQGANSVGVYAIDQTSGVLSHVAGSPFAAGQAPGEVAITPDGKFVYVSNQNDHDISGYALDPSSGALTPLPGSPYIFVNTGDAPLSLAITPAGTYLYALNASGTIDAFAIDANTGVLSALPNSPYVGSSQYGGRSIAINTTGTMAFISTGNGGPVLSFRLDSSTGDIAQISGVAYSAGQGPWYVALDPNGTNAYVSNAYAVSLGVVTINPLTGALSNIPGSAFGFDSRAANIVVVQP
jgi:6-phosphogluconolactonase (cycloisomerase 2 family)